jgi:hypothetical protein
MKRANPPTISTTSGALSDAAEEALDGRAADSGAPGDPDASGGLGSVVGGEDEASEAMTTTWRAVNDVSAQQGRASRPHRCG